MNKSVIEQLIKSAPLAPCAKNRQPWKFVVYLGNQKENLVTAIKKGLERESNGNAILPDSAFGLFDAFHCFKHKWRFSL